MTGACRVLQSLVTVYCLALIAHHATSQGLKPRPKTVGASDLSNSKQLQAVYQAARTLRGPQARQALQATRCNTAGPSATLCSAADPENLIQQAALLLATAPTAYDARTFKGVPQPRLNPAFDQDTCNLCASAAVVAAAEAAVAATLNVPASHTHLSKTYLYYCTEPGNTCASGWELVAALNNFRTRSATSYPSVQCRPNLGTNLLEATVSKQLCPKRPCEQTLADRGEFTWKNISSVWDAQDHIRQHGAVITSMSLYKDPRRNDTYHLRSFYASRPGTAPYSLEGLPPSGPEPDRHAVLLVGYDGDKREWLAFNSWGPDFADGGYFRIPHDMANIAPAYEMYGLEWTPFSPVEQNYQVRPAKRPGCFHYKIREGDYILRIAKHYFGVDVLTFILDNLATIQLEDMSRPLPVGREVLVCGATTPPRALLGDATNTTGFTQLVSPRPQPLGFSPDGNNKYTVANDTGGKRRAQMAESLRAFDGRNLYLRYGHITEICAWWGSWPVEDPNSWFGKAGWLSALQVKYGNHTGPVYGDKNELRKTCKTLGPKERITRMYLWHALFMDEWGFTTTTGKSHRFGVGGTDLTIMIAPEGACLASVSGWTGTYFWTTGDSYNQVSGLQFDWTTDC